MSCSVLLKLNLQFNQIILLRYQLSGAVFILTCTIFSSTTLNAEYQLNLNMCFNRIVLTCGGKKYKKIVVSDELKLCHLLHICFRVVFSSL
jgi:hypothetical protein